MCRYAFTNYKPHYACFDCRKAFKRIHIEDINGKKESEKEAHCPQCGALMADMGLDFAAPRKDDIKAWIHLKDLYTVGFTFHSCGCGGVGFIPRDHQALYEYMVAQQSQYTKNLKFWQAQSKTEQSPTKHTYLVHTGQAFEYAGSPENHEEAIGFWTKRLAAIEERIQLLPKKKIIVKSSARISK